VHIFEKMSDFSHHSEERSNHSGGRYSEERVVIKKTYGSHERQDGKWEKQCRELES